MVSQDLATKYVRERRKFSIPALRRDRIASRSRLALRYMEVTFSISPRLWEILRSSCRRISRSRALHTSTSKLPLDVHHAPSHSSFLSAARCASSLVCSREHRSFSIRTIAASASPTPEIDTSDPVRRPAENAQRSPHRHARQTPRGTDAGVGAHRDRPQFRLRVAGTRIGLRDLSGLPVPAPPCPPDESGSRPVCPAQCSRSGGANAQERTDAPSARFA